MTNRRAPFCAALLGLALALASPPGAARGEEAGALAVFAAGTLAVPFRELDALFERRHPDIPVQPQFGGSVMMAKRIVELGQAADILAVADYNVIPKYLFSGSGKARAEWYVGFARNAITFVYTDCSRYADAISAKNWYEVLARPGVAIGRSDPNTDPSGYQTLQMLSLAEAHYGVPGLAAKILANAPSANMRDTETALLSALQLGQIDYLAIYRSDALQHGLRHLDLPAQIDLSDPTLASAYATGVAQTKNGALHGRPIVYAATIPSGAGHPEWAALYLALLLGPDGQAIMRKNGFGVIAPGYAVGAEKVPPALRPLVAAWPGS
ncbi:MAG TPA: extracellular solute-binding protein [Stellaceae bacterium]|nr:extracellular solute-binding protein [Stellaceae bacterium]